MKDVYWALGAATLGGVVYHVGQKSIATQGNPMLLLAGVYTVALVLALVASPLFRTPGHHGATTGLWSWPVLVVGVGVILIEGGFLMAYRFGGQLQWSSIAVNGLVAIVLIPVAVVVFGERISATRLLGVVVTLAGVTLMTRR